MSLWENVKMALDAIWAHKLRSILTMVGIVIGVAAVIIIVAIGQGGEAELTSALTGDGNNVIIQPSSKFFMENNGVIPPDFITDLDLQGLRQIKGVENVITLSYETKSLSFREEEVDDVFIYGMNDNAVLESSGLKVAEGRSFRPADFQSGNAGALISHKLKEKLFGEEDPLGQIIRIGNQPVVVTGVLEPPVGFLASLQEMEVYLPQRTWSNVFGKSEIMQVMLEVDQPENMIEVGEKAVNLLHHNHNATDRYEVLNLQQIGDMISGITRVMTVVIGSIGGISLLVGGIGVMNIMLVSVTERTREIGIRMSLGATRTHILVQFLIESITLSVIGGLVGILLGSGVAALIILLSPWSAVVSWPVALGGVLFSMLFGVIFGLLPANKAARLNPIECLRHE